MHMLEERIGMDLRVFMMIFLGFEIVFPKNVISFWQFSMKFNHFQEFGGTWEWPLFIYQNTNGADSL